jgi:hypothetical protein
VFTVAIIKRCTVAQMTATFLFGHLNVMMLEVNRLLQNERRLYQEVFCRERKTHGAVMKDNYYIYGIFPRFVIHLHHFHEIKL